MVWVDASWLVVAIHFVFGISVSIFISWMGLGPLTFRIACSRVLDSSGLVRFRVLSHSLLSLLAFFVVRFYFLRFWVGLG